LTIAGLAVSSVALSLTSTSGWSEVEAGADETRRVRVTVVGFSRAASFRFAVSRAETSEAGEVTRAELSGDGTAGVEADGGEACGVEVS
jgi:hypothetical protein